MEKLVILITALLLFSSCDKDKKQVIPEIPGTDYYPLKEGKFVVYDVDSTVYNDLPVDTVFYKYRIKEKIADGFTDNEGKPAIMLERYIKKYDAAKSYDSLAWTLKQFWFVNATTDGVEVVENNVRYTKLIFPLELGVTWNGNAHNTNGEWLYAYDYFDKKETINTQPLAAVLQVKQKEFKTLISYQHYSEKYAKGVGLVHKEITDILSNNIVAGVAIEKRIETGVIYKQTLVNYGYE